MADDLQYFRRSIPASQSQPAVMARLDIGGRTFYGRSASGIRPRDISGTTKGTYLHAERHAFTQAIDARVTADEAILYVDRVPCRLCRNSFSAFSRELDLRRLDVYHPAGQYGSYIDEIDRFRLTR